VLAARRLFPLTNVIHSVGPDKWTQHPTETMMESKPTKTVG
jgi:hypothetical protein